MTTIIYFIMACSFALAAYTTAGIIYMSFSKWGIGNVRETGWAVWFISILTFLICLWRLGYIS